ncbi:MAG: PTS sugar transporter subunit IIA, partial [Quisquiliibacterium sp.]
MTRMSRLLPPSNVVTGLEVTSKKRLFEQAGLLFENNHGIERGKVFDSLFARERLGSTGLGEGVAIPHGRIKGLKETLAALVRLSHGHVHVGGNMQHHAGALQDPFLRRAQMAIGQGG